MIEVARRGCKCCERINFPLLASLVAVLGSRSGATNVAMQEEVLLVDEWSAAAVVFFCRAKKKPRELVDAFGSCTGWEI